ncbi:MAG: endonuclease/exonuclease/phosphatase family protein [Paracoccaceae bacterium]
MARTQFSVGSFNLYNLQRAGLPLYFNTTPWTQAEYDRKVAWAGRMLARKPADVWGFQELWHGEALDDVLAAAGLTAGYTPLVPQGHAGGRIVCAGAVRSDILVGDADWIEDFPGDFVLESGGGGDPQAAAIRVTIDSFSRPVLHFTVRPRTNGKLIHCYVCHFKSKMPTRVFNEPWYSAQTYSRHSEALGSAISTIRRTAEAAALRMILTERMKGTDTPVVVLGDLNDSQLSNTLNILTGQPNYILSGLSQGGSDVDLYTVGSLQEYRSMRDVYYTHVHQNVKESLDHVLVSQEFYDNSRKRVWAFKGMDLANDHLNEEDHKAAGSTDHGLVRARFEYRPA